MRRLVTLGLISAAAACTIACGDDDTTPNNPSGGSAGSGNGGRSGDGGSAGTSGGSPNTGGGGNGTGGSAGDGSSGDGGSAGSAGSAGASGSAGDPDAGDGGGDPPCTGCLELQVPVAGINQSTAFQFGITPPADFTNGVVTWRIRAPVLNDQTFVQPFSTDGSSFSFDGEFRSVNATNGFVSADQFFDFVYNLALKPAVDREVVPDAGADAGPGAPIAGDFDKSLIIAVGLQVGSAGGFVGESTITLLIDSVTFTGVGGDAVADVDFADGASGFAINTFTNPPPRPGSAVIHHPE